MCVAQNNNFLAGTAHSCQPGLSADLQHPQAAPSLPLGSSVCVRMPGCLIHAQKLQFPWGLAGYLTLQWNFSFVLALGSFLTQTPLFFTCKYQTGILVFAEVIKRRPQEWADQRKVHLSPGPDGENNTPWKGFKECAEGSWAVLTNTSLGCICGTVVVLGCQHLPRGEAPSSFPEHCRFTWRVKLCFTFLFPKMRL